MRGEGDLTLKVSHLNMTIEEQRRIRLQAVLFSAVVAVGIFFSAYDALADDPNDILIVANRNVNVKAVTVEELRSLFLKKRVNWKGGKKAIPVNAPPKSDLRQAFQVKVLGMGRSDETSYWQKKKITSGITPPPEFRKMLKAVFSLKGSVGYVYRKDHIDNVVKVLLVLPAEPGK